MADEQPVSDDQAASRFEAVVDGHRAVLAYERSDDRLVLAHTIVPDELSGRGMGGRLVAAAIDRAAAESLTIVPQCSFARDWLERHPDAADSVRIDWSAAR